MPEWRLIGFEIMALIGSFMLVPINLKRLQLRGIDRRVRLHETLVRVTTMVIGFETPELRSLCEDEAAAIAAYGTDASPLKALLADLDAAPSLLDLPAGAIQLRDGGWIAMECPSIVLLLVPNHKNYQLDDKGQLNQGKVTRPDTTGVRLAR